MKKYKIKLLSLFFTLHLLLVFFSMMMPYSDKLSNIWDSKYFTPIRVYAVYTGTHIQFDFFAPSINSSLKVSYLVEYFNGETELIEELSEKSRESQIRYENIMSNFFEIEEDESLRKAMTASWAAKVFSKRPDAKKVKVKIELFEIPQMKWSDYYESSFERKVTAGIP